MHSGETESLQVTHVRCLQTLELLAQSSGAHVLQLCINALIERLAKVGMNPHEDRHDNTCAFFQVVRIEPRDTRCETCPTRGSATRKLASLKLPQQASEL